MDAVVLGAGAIGGLVAARLAAAGRDVGVVSRHPAGRLRLEDAAGMHEVPVAALVAPEATGPVEWVVLATKAYDVPGLAPWFEALVDDRTRVAVAQNGIEHAERVATWVPAERVVPLVVRHGAHRPEPGRVVQTLVGSIAVPDTASAHAFARLTKGCGLDVRVEPDFAVDQWTKLATNLVAATITTLLDVPVREIARRAGLREIASTLVEECAAAALAEGHTLDPGLADAILDELAGHPETVTSSMWQDRQAGRPLEHEAISGAVSRVAARHGVPAPYCRMSTLVLGAMSP